MTEPDLLTVKEAALMLRMHEKTVRRKIDRGEIPGVIRLGRTIRVSRDTLRRFLHERCTA